MSSRLMKRLMSACLCLMAVCVAFGQTSTGLAYFDQYKKMAVDQMNRYRVPASITLAQGFLESGGGQSRLARQGKNHFGIKCGSSWTGPYMLVNDDAPNERFRVYKSVADSYEDHSQFLRNNRRYASLFQLQLTDYKGWAHGLKAAGYATNPKYAYHLIEIIEQYELYKYDKGGRFLATDVETFAGYHRINRCNKNYYTLAKAGDTFASIAKEMGVSERKLRKYNEVGKDAVLEEGDIVYFEKKQKNADRALKGKYHEVMAGQSMYGIAQMYGMRLSTLYKINGLDANHQPHVGERLILRW